MPKELRIPGYAFARVFDEVDSTMVVAREVSPEFSASGYSAALVLAKHQTAGRGRQGRTWENTDAAFMGTFLFRCALPVSALAGYSLAVGVHVAKALHDINVDLRLKWPNDLMSVSSLDGSLRKLGGILLDVHEEGDQTLLLVGMGINLKGTPSSTTKGAALQEAFGIDLESEDVARLLAPSLLDGNRQFMALGGFSPWHKAWSALSCFSDEILNVEVGSEVVSGRYLGIGDTGTLLLNVDGKVREIHSGHLLGWRATDSVFTGV